MKIQFICSLLKQIAFTFAFVFFNKASAQLSYEPAEEFVPYDFHKQEHTFEQMLQLLQAQGHQHKHERLTRQKSAVKLIIDQWFPPIPFQPVSNLLPDNARGSVVVAIKTG